MSEPTDRITTDPEPDTTAITGEPAQPLVCQQTAGTTDIAVRRRWLPLVIAGAIVGAVIVLAAGLVPLIIVKIREAQDRTQSQNNLRDMGRGLHNVAANTPQYGYIPPSYGEFPAGSGYRGSFFKHLFPYFYQWNVEGPPPPPEFPVGTYCAAADIRNSREDGTISYCSNATLLGVNEAEPPRMPNSFNGRTNGLIVVMERSGLDGAHKWCHDSNYLGDRNNPPPPPQFGARPANWVDGWPQAFTSAGCLVLLGDGSARIVNTNNVRAGAWNWACDPTITRPQPSEW
jgi:hypothetical protein